MRTALPKIYSGRQEAKGVADGEYVVPDLKDNANVESANSEFTSVRGNY